MTLKAFIKVTLVLIENFVFSVFPFLRPMVERYVFNPLDFKNSHLEYSQKKFKEFRNRTVSLVNPEGKTVLELGPGGSLGFGLLALEAGAKKYIAIDDGIHTFIGKKQLLQYGKILRNPAELNRYFIRKNKKFTYNTSVLEYVSIDQYSRYPLADESSDIIYSCAVLEHVHNLDLCFFEMSRVLKPGGIMYHEVDLRDHIFSQKSIWFLTMHDFWFRMLFSNTGGYVNRKRTSHYRKIAKRNRLSIVFFEATMKYEGNVVPRKIQTRYSEEDIRTLAFYIVLKKES